MSNKEKGNEDMKKQILWVVIFTSFVAFLTGCSAAEQYLEKRMMKESGIYETSEYQAYEKFTEENKLDVNGFYAEYNDALVTAKPSIHVTFGENSNLRIQYYLDGTHQEPLDKSQKRMLKNK